MSASCFDFHLTSPAFNLNIQLQVVHTSHKTLGDPNVHDRLSGKDSDGDCLIRRTLEHNSIISQCRYDLHERKAVPNAPSSGDDGLKRDKDASSLLWHGDDGHQPAEPCLPYYQSNTAQKLYLGVSQYRSDKGARPLLMMYRALHVYLSQ